MKTDRLRLSQLAGNTLETGRLECEEYWTLGSTLPEIKISRTDVAIDIRLNQRFSCQDYQRHIYIRIVIMQTMSTPIMMESRRRRDLIIDTKLLMPGMVIRVRLK
jgi:hypothetical protein